MPTLPEGPEAPAGPTERVSAAMRRAGAAIGADARVTVRALVALATLGIAASTGPFPWPQIGAVALVILCLDWARRSR